MNNTAETPRPEVIAVREGVLQGRRLEAVLAVLKRRSISARGRRNGKRRLAEEILAALADVEADDQ